MPPAIWLADILKDAGLRLFYVDGWESRGGFGFAPKGVMQHHTVTSPGTADAVVDRMLAIRGSSTVPPPLCNYSTNRDGSVSVIAAGIANHGGKGFWQGYDSNRYFFGDEMKNLGTSAEPWPIIQLDSARVAAAAVLKHLGADAGMLCGHKEYATPPGRKTDPHTLDMDRERVEVDAIMRGDDMLTEKEENVVRDLLALLEADGLGTRESRKGRLDKIVQIGKNYPTVPAPGDGGVSEDRVKELIAFTRLEP